ncbi:MAG: hypothetical protein EA398_00665 [Deltaproteobacteria bacterium]|nr:MAG: hypothetical protein EA398_00665 [Deltaproteobacteria bacterium]
MRENGTVWCWGSSEAGRLGNGSEVAGVVFTPSQVRASSQTEVPWRDWDTLAVYGSHSCGIRNDGELWCWGAGSLGRLGDGDASNGPRPRRVVNDTTGATSSDWTSVDPGGAFTCGMRGRSDLWCWGYAQHGQLGIGVPGSPFRSTPQRTPDPGQEP